MHIHLQRPPLKVIRAFEVEDGGQLVHLHNVSGGVLSGDCLTVVAMLAPGAKVQLTTTGATRLYRNRPGSPGAMQVNQFSVGEDALLEIVPDAIIPYTGALYTQRTDITLAPGAGLFWWEVLAPGRNKERFSYQAITLKTSITAEGRPIALEYLHLRPECQPLRSAVRLGPYGYSAAFYVCRAGLPAADWTLLEGELAALAAELSIPNEIIWGVSALTRHGVVVRALGNAAPEIYSGLQRFWKVAKCTLYGREPILPRKIY